MKPLTNTTQSFPHSDKNLLTNEDINKNPFIFVPMLIEDQNYTAIDFSQEPLAKGEYEYCSFDRCDFSNNNLSSFRFVECHFKDCNLSSAILKSTAFQDASFKNCKMLGLHFEHCNTFGLSFVFEHCKLDHSSFYKLDLKKHQFKTCHLYEVDFSECNLTSAIFTECSLERAIFQNSILEKADFRTAYNYTIDPTQNRMNKARFSRQDVHGLLSHLKIIIE